MESEPLSQVSWHICQCLNIKFNRSKFMISLANTISHMGFLLLLFFVYFVVVFVFNSQYSISEKRGLVCSKESLHWGGSL